MFQTARHVESVFVAVLVTGLLLIGMAVLWVTILFATVGKADEAPQGYRNGMTMPGGTTAAGHAQYHDVYNGLFNNKKGVSCCHDRDCRPTQARQIFEGDAPHWEVMINGHWIRVDENAIIPKGIDGIAHVCAGEPTSVDPDGRIYCVILPPQG